MNQKRDDVNKFIEKQLPKDIKEILSQTQSKDSVQLQQDLDKLGSDLDNAGVVRESSPKYLELKKMIEASVDLTAMEQEIFSHLTNFFKRYYNEGDFISQRRYKKDVYAIPYEGEEVKLHWANADQYYIKTSEYLKDYAFVLPGNKKKVVFQLKEASTEQNNNKTQGDGERRFAIYEEEPIEVDGNTLYINFTYELHKKSVKQDDLIKKAFNTISSNIPVAFADICAAGSAPTEKNKARTLIEKHLTDYVSRNTFDYFIHKDLGAFLRRELDFYIKNEILYIDDINTESPAFFTAQLSKIKAFKTVADKIINFLAQIEDFQKKLWLKKKIVIRTDYCITIDRIPEKYHQEIVKNKGQVEEWKELFDVKVSKVEDLVFEQFLVLDTKHFSDEFKDKLIAEFYNLDEETNGLLINSENFQALNLMKRKYEKRIQLIYIDPPFNKLLEADYLYKVNYKDSTWINLLIDRINVSRSLLKDSGSKFVRCDFDGNQFVRSILDNLYSNDNFLNEIVINRINKQDPRAKKLNVFTDSLFFYSKNCIEHKFNHVFVKLKKPKEARWHAMDSQGQGKSSLIFGMLLEPPSGRHWTYGQERIKQMEVDAKIRLRCRECSYVHYQGKINKCPECGNNTNFGVDYYLEPSNSKQLGTDWTDIPGYSSKWKFKTENSEKLLKRVIEVGTFEHNNIVLDYFLGSGTTSATSLKLNRKFIGIDMGSHFNDIALPRIKQTASMKGSEPSGISNEIEFSGSSILLKYQVLESYEDTLNNLILAQKDLGKLGFDEEAQEEYLLQYMLDVESRDHLFDVEIFKNPFDYKLKVTENNELIPTKVDLVETFNYLIGLYVEHIQKTKDIKFVEGTTREGVKTLVIWRNLETTTNKETEEVFRRLFESERTSEFHQIYINGDHNLTNFRTGEDQFKVKMIEETFFNAMFNIKQL